MFEVQSANNQTIGAAHDMDYGINVGDTACHVKDYSLTGIVVEIDTEYDQGGVTTCRVAWGASSLEEAKSFPREDQDIQWTNKLVRVEH